MSLPETESHATHADSTHAVDILAFVEAQEIPSRYFETPYQLAPAPGTERLYAMLREALQRSRKIGIACVVIEARQYLAAVVPQGQSLVLNTLRWRSEDRHAGMLEKDAADEDAADEAGTVLAPLRHDPLYIEKGDTHRRLDAFLPRRAALAERIMKTKKSTNIVLEELDSLIEDDDLMSDEYLEIALRRTSHHPARYASRAGAPASASKLKHTPQRDRLRR